MDSSNLHHQVEDHQLMVGSSSNPLPSLSSPSFSVEDNDHAWSRATPTFFLNNNDNIHAACDEATPNTLNNPIVQEVDFPWPNDRISINQSSPHQEHHHHLHQQRIIAEKIKEEQSPSSTSSDHHHHTNNSTFAKFSDLLSSSSTTTSSEMLLLKNTLLSPTYKNHMFSNNTNLHQPPSLLFQPSIQYQQNNNNNNTINKGISTTFSQIFPSVNISNMIMSNNNNNNISTSPLLSSSSSKIDDNSNNNNNNSNVEGGFDLFATARLLSGESLNHSSPSNNLLELFEGSPRFSVDHDLQQSNNDLKLCKIAHNNISSFNNNGVPAESKNYIMEQKSDHHQTASKKQRSESRASCPPFKVRKEKLGDRIAALQQLVAPFGKTDTASVLMEAIGYIKFLQNQVETLSVPYMKLASRNKNSNTPRVTNDEYCGSDEPKLTDDLRSRGLCLVPLSCTTYINLASDATSNGGIWPPTNFNPAPGF